MFQGCIETFFTFNVHKNMRGHDRERVKGENTGRFQLIEKENGERRVDDPSSDSSFTRLSSALLFFVSTDVADCLVHL